MGGDRFAGARSRRTFAVVLAGAALSLLAGAVAPRATGAPSNDAFASAQSLSGASGSVAGSTTDATAETGEPGSPRHSVWYVWTAPAADTYTLDLGGASIHGRLDVYTGSSLDTLTNVASGADTQGIGQLRVSFAAAAGTTYDIRVDDDGTSGSFTLRWWDPAHDPSPANDLYANAQSLSGASGSVDGTTVDATLEPGEQNITGGSTVATSAQHSVWYSWTAPQSGTLVLWTASSTFDPALGVFLASGGSASSSAGMKTDDDEGPWSREARLAYDVTSGTAYRIAVAGKPFDTGTFELHWLLLAPSSDTTPPSATVTSPTADGPLRATATLAATVTDDTAVAFVEWWITPLDTAGPSEFVGAVESAPYSLDFDTTLLADGRYDIVAKAYDTSGNLTQTTVSAYVDNVAPETTLTAASTSGSTASFSFTGNKAGDTFECDVDATGYSDCTSPIVFRNVVAGDHSFAVRAVFLGRADMTPATYSWTVGGGTGGGTGGGLLPNLGLAITATSSTLQVKGTDELTFLVTNHGDYPALQTDLKITVPPGLSVVGTPTTGQGAGCTGTTAIDCPLDAVPTGLETQVVVDVEATAAGSAVVQASVSADRDSDLSDNTAAVTLAVSAAPAPPKKKPPTAKPKQPKRPAHGRHLTGGRRNDHLGGTKYADVLNGLGGNDVLRGRAGNDILRGGPGNDLLYGGPGADRLVGGPGADRLNGGTGADRIWGGAGNDVVYARDGFRDHISCGPGRDTVFADRKDVVARDCERVHRS